jgi:hypothetical protein
MHVQALQSDMAGVHSDRKETYFFPQIILYKYKHEKKKQMTNWRTTKYCLHHNFYTGRKLLNAMLPHEAQKKTHKVNHETLVYSKIV